MSEAVARAANDGNNAGERRTATKGHGRAQRRPTWQMMLLYDIGVAEAHRRRGVGKQMIGTLKAICRGTDVFKMWVPTGRSNIAATGLYGDTGAEPCPDGDEVTYTYPRESFMNVSR